MRAEWGVLNHETNIWNENNNYESQLSELENELH